MSATRPDTGEWIDTTLARERSDWERVHITHHEQYDGMAPGHGRLFISLGRCQVCGALIEVPSG